ncbi:type II toxin-antitoxin system prevent-host-death family antitoxin [Pseudokineococcus basanitobsidens]|uniref:Type II toxin-antitoxin system prevent-host-death family antitoxin n=1 Tax=Pseudokineococcus basanitobsidens TaxID=1926649 RepID=A0ABU8RP01_9ACTN
MRTIASLDLRHHTAEVLRQVTGGTSVTTITVNGSPVAEISPVRLGRRQFLSRADLTDLLRHGQADPGLRADLGALGGRDHRRAGRVMTTRPAVLDTSVLITRECGRALDVAALLAETAVSVVTLAELHVGVLAAVDTETRGRPPRPLLALRRLLAIQTPCW